MRPKRVGRGIDPGRVQAAALTIIAFAVVLFLLVQARFLLISLAVAIVIFSLTSDAINSIARVRIGPLRVPNWLASIVALLAIATALMSLTSIILAQVNTVLSTTLSYAERAPTALAELFSFLGPEAEKTILNFTKSIEVTGYLRTAAGQAGSLVQASVLVTLFVGFLFAERVWFETKLRNLFANPAQAERFGQVVGTIIHRVNYYLLVKSFVSAVTGVLVWLVAEYFDLDLATALGILTFVLNYIPSVGSIIATVLVALVSYIQQPDPVQTAAIFAIVGMTQFVLGNVIDPMLMGRALRLSSFGIIISLAFWAAVWGIPGMFLSVPIMVSLMIVCSQLPELRPIAILLSREGLPDPEAQALGDKAEEEAEAARHAGE
ncbi:MAG TPA: AI-2E family transporter [Rhodobacteraceae bacterium]|nr:AI-2E family transporter [Paracoccaceae bacterium]HBV54920.1 AI-2E family transporter [Paracoccaceae bacterium]